VLADPLPLIAVLCLNIALAEWLVRHTALRHLGSALLVIVITAITANVGLIPPYDDANPSPIYSSIFSDLAPLAIFWLLLGVRLDKLAQVGAPLLLLFLLGAIGTAVGVLGGMALVDGETVFGDKYHVLGGMFVGTYTGGSANFVAVAQSYEFRGGALFLGAVAVDSAMTTVWMAINVAVPRFLGRYWPKRAGTEHRVSGEAITGETEDTGSVNPLGLAILTALGVIVLWGSRELERMLDFKDMKGVSILILTTASLIIAQTPIAKALNGARTLGMFAVMLFLAVIGALCDVGALMELKALGVDLTIFVATVVLIHGLIVYGAAWLFRVDPVIASVASQANIGGGTSALALARSLGRAELVLPAILIGSLGTALGTALGLRVAAWLM